jgi:hypothetical protein
MGIRTVQLTLPAQRVKPAEDITGTAAAATVGTPATPQINVGIKRPALKTSLKNPVIVNADWIAGAQQS